MGYSRYWNGLRLAGQPVPNGPQDYAQTVQMASATYPGSLMSSDTITGRGSGIILGAMIIGLALYYLNSRGIS